MNWENEANVLRMLSYLQTQRMDILPGWAMKEEIFNCEEYYQRFIRRSVKTVQIRKLLANGLRRIADKLYTQNDEKSYSYIR